MRIKLAYRIAPLFLFFAMNAYAEKNAPPLAADTFHHPFYVGIAAGYGATTWNRLVSTDQSAAMTLSTPIRTEENGSAWGVFGGYEFIPTFAVEAAYARYPTAKVYFDSMSLFTFDYNATEMSSRTDVVSLSGKFMVFIPHTTIRAFSAAGVAGVHRSDYVFSGWIIRPTFSVGLNYNVTERAMVEIGANYTAGTGQAELNPANHYVPFTYGIFARIAYRF